MVNKSSFNYISFYLSTKNLNNNSKNTTTTTVVIVVVVVVVQ